MEPDEAERAILPAPKADLRDDLEARRKTVASDEGFDQERIENDLSSDPDAIDAEEEQPEPEEQEASENAPLEQEELSDEQKGLLTEIEKSFAGCRSLVDLDREIGKYKDDVEAGGPVFLNEANKLYYGRRAELGAKS